MNESNIPGDMFFLLVRKSVSPKDDLYDLNKLFVFHYFNEFNFSNIKLIY